MEKKLQKKLILNKKTIAGLNRQAMKNVEGGWSWDCTGDCLSFIGVTCPDCDFQSIPLDECNISLRLTHCKNACPTGPCPPMIG